MNYFEVIQRVERVLGRVVTSGFTDLTNEFQLNIKSLVNQVNKDVLMQYTYPCRKRTTTLSISAETSENYSSVTNSIPGEIATDTEGRTLIYDTDDEVYYSYNPNSNEFILGHAGAYEYGFRNNLILFDAHDEARTLTVEYYTNKLALSATAYEDFVEGTTTEDDELEDETDYSILPSFLHEPILVYGTCYYFELQKNESLKVMTFKDRFNKGIMQLNAHNRAEAQKFRLKMGETDRDFRRSAI